ncbi:hypothetical protein [Paenibacillus alvei]|nr:hypothetical protein [Paenibacillus alvei]
MNKWLKISLYFLGGDRAIGMCGESKYVGSGRIMCPQRCLADIAIKREKS